MGNIFKNLDSLPLQLFNGYTFPVIMGLLAVLCMHTHIPLRGSYFCCGRH